MTPPLEDRKERASAWFGELRDLICARFEALEDALGGVNAERFAGTEPGRFEGTAWTRPGGDGQEGGGGGVMSVMRGRVFEKVGVNVSTVFGAFSDEFRKQIPGAADDGRFWASGISLVAHLQSPLVPAVHVNTRHVVTTKGWFGGGADLTPMVEDETDTRDFHAAMKAACDAHDPDYHPRFKDWCDEYFYLKHRGEARGVGGIFFNYLSDDRRRGLDFILALGETFAPAYLPLLERRKDTPYGQRERDFQSYRRGRYVEFNLIYDQGTLFGLQSEGRVESILVSLPPLVRWKYDWKPPAGSPEESLTREFLIPRDWAADSSQ